jgi:molecular chaperone DnaK (HSP70)
VKSDNIEVIHDWPCQSSKNATQEKVPSQVAYREEGILWGSQIPPDVPRHMWTKLQLDNKQTGEVAKINREIATCTENAGKQPDDVITDYLTQIKAHLIKNFDQKYGKTLWRTMPITLVVTVPAVWSDLAKARTLDAVDKAGFNTLEFPQLVKTIITTEPEAAAIYTIQTLRGM